MADTKDRISSSRKPSGTPARREISPMLRVDTVLGGMKGTVLKYDRPFDPVDGEWDVNGG